MVPDHWSNDAMVPMDRCGLSLLVRDGVNPGGKAVSNMVRLRISIVW